MLVVGSSGIDVTPSGASAPGGVLHALGPGQLPLCGAARVAYRWPSVPWTRDSQAERCAVCVERAASRAPIPPPREPAAVADPQPTIG